jgi:hypothetical protein
LFKNEVLNYLPENNICCSETDEQDIIQISNYLKDIPKYSSLHDKDKFIVFIFAFYSLVYGEQTTDYLNTRFLRRHLYDYVLGKELYIEITTGDLVYDGQNLSSKFRRHIFGMSAMGKSRKNKSKGKRNRKTKKTKTKRKRTNKK